MVLSNPQDISYFAKQRSKSAMAVMLQAAPACLYRLAALLSWATFCTRNFRPGLESNSRLT